MWTGLIEKIKIEKKKKQQNLGTTCFRRRRNPLHLCMERYKKLQKIWLGHSIAEEIAHQLESSTKLYGVEWFNF